MFVIWMLLAILATLLVLLVIPLDFKFSILRDKGLQEITGEICWFFGLMRVGLGIPKESPRAKRERPEKKKRKDKHSGSRRMMFMLRTNEFGWRLLKLVRKLLRHVHIHKLRIQVRLGLDDPADTGQLWSVIGPVASLLSLSSIAHIAIEPEFREETLEVDGAGHIRIIPVELLFVTLVFLLSPKTIRSLYRMKVAT